MWVSRLVSVLITFARRRRISDLGPFSQRVELSTLRARYGRSILGRSWLSDGSARRRKMRCRPPSRIWALMRQFDRSRSAHTKSDSPPICHCVQHLMIAHQTDHSSAQPRCLRPQSIEQSIQRNRIVSPVDNIAGLYESEPSLCHPPPSKIYHSSQPQTPQRMRNIPVEVPYGHESVPVPCRLRLFKVRGEERQDGVEAEEGVEAESVDGVDEEGAQGDPSHRDSHGRIVGPFCPRVSLWS